MTFHDHLKTESWSLKKLEFRTSPILGTGHHSPYFKRQLSGHDCNSLDPDLKISPKFSWYAQRDAPADFKSKSTLVKRPAAGFWFKGRDNKMASYPYGEKSPIYSGNAYDIFARDFLVWFFQDEKIKENLKLS